MLAPAVYLVELSIPASKYCGVDNHTFATKRQALSKMHLLMDELSYEQQCVRLYRYEAGLAELVEMWEYRHGQWVDGEPTIRLTRTELEQLRAKSIMKMAAVFK